MTRQQFIPLQTDITPDAFSFTDQTGVALSTVIESNTITVAGINASADVWAGGAEYSVNGGAWATTSSAVILGNTVKVRHTSSASNSTSVDTTLTIGDVSDIFTSTTVAASSHGGGGGGSACGSGFVFNSSTLGCDRIGANQGQVLGVSTGPACALGDLFDSNTGKACTVSATSVVTTTTTGQVLGASTYFFTRYLVPGSRGAEVTTLQQFLIDSGYSIPFGATGYFGVQTRAAVIAFQKAHGIAQVGMVGPITRAALNKGITPTATNLTSVQADAILSLLESFGADASVVAKVRASLGR